MDPEVVETYAVLLIIVQSFFQLPATILLCEVGNAQRGADPAPPGGEVPQNGDNAARPSGRPGARPGRDRGITEKSDGKLDGTFSEKVSGVKTCPLQIECKC